MKTLIPLGLIAALAATAAPLSFAQDSGEVTAIEAARKVNISGRQRMLSQRMAKAACLMARDVSFATTYDQLTQSYTLFQRSDTALRIGDEQMGLPAEGFPEILDALATIDAPWAEYNGILENAVESGTIEESDLATLDGDSREVLKYMNIAVFKIARAYAGAIADVPLGLTITIDVAGRQRMLTQKAVKEACLMTFSSDPAVYADRLIETIELFDLSLKALRDGYEDVGVIAAPSREIDRKLQEVAGLWTPVKSILQRAAEGQILSDRDLSKVARISEPLLQTMNEAVQLYEGADRFL